MSTDWKQRFAQCGADRLYKDGLEYVRTLCEEWPNYDLNDLTGAVFLAAVRCAKTFNLRSTDGYRTALKSLRNELRREVAVEEDARPPFRDEDGLHKQQLALATWENLASTAVVPLREAQNERDPREDA